MVNIIPANLLVITREQNRGKLIIRLLIQPFYNLLGWYISFAHRYSMVIPVSFSNIIKVQFMQIRNVVVKIASRCNLNCSYCYMYNLGDNTYKSQPKVMPLAVVDELMYRVKENCLAHGTKGFSFILHGGEPLLAGKDFFKYFKQKADDVLGGITELYFGLQTNAVLLDEDWCKFLGEFGYGLGISLDGPKAINDAFRVDHAGRGSYDDIIKGLKTAQSTGYLQSPGLLSVINVNTDPIEIYDHFKSLKVNGVNFLLPDANYDHLPPSSVIDSETPYGDWYIKLFDQWFYERSDNTIDITYFSMFVDYILGSKSTWDNMGKEENSVLVIETNGGIESVDVLKICGDGFTKTEANVLTHSFDDATQTALAKIYRYSGSMLSKKCLACPVSETCGGGYIPHRYSSKNGFNNPSVYCNDLMKLITHIQNRVIENLPEEVVKESGAQKITYEECQAIIAANINEIVEPGYAQELMMK